MMILSEDQNQVIIFDDFEVQVYFSRLLFILV